MKTYIIGHQKPDTDAVVATLAFKHIFDQDECWGHSNSIPCITHPLNPETKYVFNLFNQTAPSIVSSKDINLKDKVVLVDHNEESQRLKDLNPAQITDIFDHHKLNLNLNQPIFVTTKSWGSTCTIAWHLIDLYKYSIPTDLAALMLCAILSDTVGFKSSTTTDVDKKAAQALAKIANLDTKELAFKILKAKSNLDGLTDEQIITKDCKLFDFNGKNVFINQIETVEQEKLLSVKKEALLKALQTYKQKQNLDLAFVAVTDVLKLNTKLLLASKDEAKAAETAFGGQAQANLLDIGPKLSRKKDIAPKIEKVVT